MTTSADTEQARTGLELIAEAIIRLRSTDPADTEAALLAAWHGFCTAQAAGGLLAQDNPDDAVLARNARSVMAAVATRLREAPSLPYTDQIAEIVNGLVPDDVGVPVDDQEIVYYDPAQPVDHCVAGVVRRAILTLVLELNTVLPQAAEVMVAPVASALFTGFLLLGYSLPLALGSIVLGLLVSLRYSGSYAVESVDRRLARHGYPREYGSTVRREAYDAAHVVEAERYRAVYRRTEE
jgi:hypothetical protein